MGGQHFLSYNYREGGDTLHLQCAFSSAVVSYSDAVYARLLTATYNLL
jgi:hypothetical protein